jgi:hypothetical protein
MGKRYEITGKPNVPFDILLDHAVGDVVEADLDKEQEQLLIEVGAIRELPAEKKQADKKSTSSSSRRGAQKSDT